MLIETIVLGPFQCNCTIIADDKTREAMIIDPGDEPDKILELIKYYNLNIKYMLHTHAHLDHIMGTRKVKEYSNGEILLHQDDNDIYNKLKMQAAIFGFNVEDPVKVDKFISHNDIIKLGESISTKVIHTPGHSPGSVCFHFENFEKPMIFSGDTLFAGSIGRTDLWGASHSQLLKSVRERIFPIEESTVVCPGHGEKTTIWQEKKKNPFFI